MPAGRARANRPSNGSAACVRTGSRRWTGSPAPTWPPPSRSGPKETPRRTVGHLLAWANAELMKNVAEIGQLRLQRAAR